MMFGAKNILSFFSGVLEANFERQRLLTEANRLALENKNIEVLQSAEALNSSYNSLNRTDNLRYILSLQNAQNAASGLTGESFQAIQNADISRYTRDRAFEQSSLNVKRALANTKRESPKNIESAATLGFGLGIARSFANSFLGIK